MVSVAMSGENICELVFAHRGESLKFISDCALSEEAPYFLWTKCAGLTFDWPNETLESQDKKDGYRQQNVRQRQKLISIIDYDVCILKYFYQKLLKSNSV